jgi:hypothetical protein
VTTFDEAALALYQTYAQAMDEVDVAYARDEAAVEQVRRAEVQRIDGLQDQDADKATRAAGEAFDRAYRLNVYSDDRANLVRARTEGERSAALVALSERAVDQIFALVAEFAKAHIPLTDREDVEAAIFGPPPTPVPAEQAVRDALQGIKDGGPMLVRHEADQEWLVTAGDSAHCRESLLAAVRRRHRTAHQDAYVDERAAVDDLVRTRLAAAQRTREETISRARSIYEAKLAALRQALQAVHLPTTPD